MDKKHLLAELRKLQSEVNDTDLRDYAAPRRLEDLIELLEAPEPGEPLYSAILHPKPCALHGTVWAGDNGPLISDTEWWPPGLEEAFDWHLTDDCHGVAVLCQNEDIALYLQQLIRADKGQDPLEGEPELDTCTCRKPTENPE